VNKGVNVYALSTHKY